MNILSSELRSIDSAEPRLDGASQVATSRELARDWWQRNARRALDLADTVKQEATVASDRTRGYVRDEPLRSVLLAASAGALLIGLLVLFGRRR